MTLTISLNKEANFPKGSFFFLDQSEGLLGAKIKFKKQNQRQKKTVWQIFKNSRKMNRLSLRNYKMHFKFLFYNLRITTTNF